MNLMIFTFQLLLSVCADFTRDRANANPYPNKLTLPPLEAAGFLLHRERPAVAGLTLAPQAFILSVCPTARSILTPSSLTFMAAL